MQIGTGTNDERIHVVPKLTVGMLVVVQQQEHRKSNSKSSSIRGMQNSRRRSQQCKLCRKQVQRIDKVRAIHIFIKVDGSKVLPLEMSPRNTVGDIMRRIPNSACDEKQEVYVTCEGGVLRGSDEELRDRWWEDSAGRQEDARKRKAHGQEGQG